MQTKSPGYVFWFAMLAVGVGSGVLGMMLNLLLHTIQHLAYGRGADDDLLQGIIATPAWRRISIMMLCGLIAGFGWWLLYNFGRKLISIEQALKTHTKMPALSTIIHALLQIVTIALGSPLGREVAPREMGAIFATWVTSRTHLTPTEINTLIACGAGAGLAASYNMPIGGAIFTLEVLLCSFRLALIIPAFVTSIIAVAISWIGLGDEALYHVPQLPISYSLIICAVISSPIFGLAAYWFRNETLNARQNAQTNWTMIVFCLLNFTLIGLLAIYYPSLLGNGSIPTQITFDQTIGITLSASLLFLRTISVWCSLRSGAQGGLLTPSLANGALLAAVLGSLWCLAWPNLSLNAFSIIGAAAFLATAQKMPLTAIVLIVEVTHIDWIFIIPITLAVAGSMAMNHACEKWFAR